MLTDNKIIMQSKLVIDEKDVCTFLATIDVDKNDISFSHRQIDKALCKEHRETVRKDLASFEDMAYQIQESVMGNE